MPIQKKTGLTGFCSGAMLYDFGHAHMRETFKSLDDFFESLFKAVNAYPGTNDYFAYYKTLPQTLYFGFTNRNQSQERKWLTEIGFTSTEQEGLMVHSIGRTALIRYKLAYDERKKKEKEKTSGKVKEPWEETREETIARLTKEGRGKCKDETFVRNPGERYIGDVVYNGWGAITLNTHNYCTYRGLPLYKKVL